MAMLPVGEAGCKSGTSNRQSGKKSEGTSQLEFPGLAAAGDRAVRTTRSADQPFVQKAVLAHRLRTGLLQFGFRSAMPEVKP